jgi:hypothetical protein
MAITLAVAMLHVAIEKFKKVFSQIRDLYAFLLRPINHMLRCSYATAGGYLRIALLVQFFGEPCK